MNGLALFAGGGGLELGLSLALGTNYRPVAYVEREATSAAVLAANMERGWLDKAPVWDDITTFTGDVVSPLVDNIDIVTAGFPCQPWSLAGNRKGTDDERWLWPHIFGLVREIRPGNIFLENVPGLLHGGIEHVLGDLASVGFDAEWTCVRASDVGAPHRRDRVFVLAHSTELRLEGRKSFWKRKQLGTRIEYNERELGNTGSERRWTQGFSDQQTVGIDWASRPFFWPPSPASIDWQQIISERPGLAPAIKPEVRGVANGMARGLARNDQLRILGNGVVPQQAAFAYTLLRTRLNE